VNALRQARSRILPEGPWAPRIDLGWMLSNGTQPERIIGESTFQIVVVEIRGSIDDRSLAIMLLQLVHEDLHLFPHLCRRWPSLAGRIAVPFHIDDWRKRIGFLGNIADEPIGLLACYTAPIEEVIGATLDACRLRLAPVLAEHGVEMISAVG